MVFPEMTVPRGMLASRALLRRAVITDIVPYERWCLFAVVLVCISKVTSKTTALPFYVPLCQKPDDDTAFFADLGFAHFTGLCLFLTDLKGVSKY